MDPATTAPHHTLGEPGPGDVGLDNSTSSDLVLSPHHDSVKDDQLSDEDTKREDKHVHLQPFGTLKKLSRRDKQREKRKQKRALHRAGVEFTEAQDNQHETRDNMRKLHHHPNQTERTALKFMEMDQWSRIYLDPMSRISILNEGGPLNNTTALEMSEVAEKLWGGKAQKRTFRSAKELAHFLLVKSNELRFFKTMLQRVSLFRENPSKSQDLRAQKKFLEFLGPSLQAWAKRGITDKEVLEDALTLFEGTIILRLEAQIEQLHKKSNSANILQKELNSIQAKIDERKLMQDRLAALREDQSYIFPISPVWEELHQDIKVVRSSLNKMESAYILGQKKKEIKKKYTQELTWDRV